MGPIPPGKLGERKAEGVALHIGVPPLAGLISAVLTILQPVVGDILGISTWRGTFPSGGVWSAGVTAMVWYTAIAVMAGSLCAHAIFHHRNRPVADYRRTALGAVIGALFAIPFVASLSGTADVSSVPWPGIHLATAVPLGALLGAGLTWVVFRRRTIAVGIWVHVAWVWFLGFASVLLSWGDNVEQTVPLGAAALGGPADDAAPIEHTVHGLASSLMSILALVGPIAAAFGVTWWVSKHGGRVIDAVAAGLAGPVIVSAAYLFRPDALAGDNMTWFLFSLRSLLLSSVAVGVFLFLSGAFQRGFTDDEPSPLLRVRLDEPSRES